MFMEKFCYAYISCDHVVLNQLVRPVLLSFFEANGDPIHDNRLQFSNPKFKSPLRVSKCLDFLSDTILQGELLDKPRKVRNGMAQTDPFFNAIGDPVVS